MLDSGSDNTHLTQKIADALQVQHPKDIILPLASLHSEQSAKTADVIIGIRALYSSCPVMKIPVYATTMDDFGCQEFKLKCRMRSAETSPPKHKIYNNQGQQDRNFDWSRCIQSNISSDISQRDPLAPHMESTLYLVEH